MVPHSAFDEQGSKKTVPSDEKFAENDGAICKPTLETLGDKQ